MNTTHAMRNTIIGVGIIALIAAVVMMSGIYLSRAACAQHANTSQACVSYGPFWMVKENPNIPPPVPEGAYATVGECAQHANTSQLCKQSPEDSYWRVTTNANIPTPADTMLVESERSKYTTSDECLQQALTTLSCVQDPVDKLWYHVSNNHP